MAGNILYLIRKDLCALWSEKSMGPLFLLLLIMAAIFASYLTISGLVFVLLIASSYTLNIFSLDEKFRTEKFFASLPIRRREIVVSRYCGILFLAAAYFLMAYLANAVSFYMGKAKLPFLPLGYCASVFVVLACITSFTFPFYFKLGLARAKTVTSLLLALFMGLGGMLAAFSINAGTPQITRAIAEFVNSPFPRDPIYVLLLFVTAFLLFAVSINVAAAIYSRRDF